MKKVFGVFLLVLSFFVYSRHAQVYAGSDITVECTTSSCIANPANNSLFDELNITPGYTVTQQVTAKNSSGQNGMFGVVVNNLNTQVENQVNLAAKILVEIHKGSENGVLVYGGSGQTLQDMTTADLTQLSFLSPDQSENFFFKATFDPQAGNEYQNMTSTFDLDLGFEFTPVEPTPTSTSGSSTTNNSSSGGGGGGGGGTSQASAPVCTDSAPSGTPTLLSAIPGGSQVTLSWTAADGADGYAINFGIQSGVYLYGNPNVGNVTSYVVSGLTPGNQYFFQIIPLHGCAAGPRSNEISTNGRLLAAGTAINPPNGFGNSVLGVETEASKEAEENSENNPSVLGDQSECIPWKVYLPIIFLIIQIIASVIVYVVMRNPQNKVKQLVVIGIIIVCAAFFYFLRSCDCAQATFFAILCKWYIVVALASALITQFINYALIEKEQ